MDEDKRKEEALEELRHITFNLSDNEIDVNKLMELIQLTIEDVEIPEEDQVDKFLERFYRKNAKAISELKRGMM